MPENRKKEQPQRVTELELSILQQIWNRDNLVTVGDIVQLWPEEAKPGYTTVLKTLQKMETKGVVGHKRDGKRYLYFSKLSRENVTDGRLASIIGRIFSGSKVSFAEYFIKSADLAFDEIKELKRLIAQKEKELKS